MTYFLVIVASSSSKRYLSKMFSSNNNRSTRLTCGFKVNTNSPEWYRSMTNILKKVKGGNFTLDAEEGVAYVTGQGDPNKLLKLMGSKKSRATQMAFVKSGGPHDQYPNYYHNNNYGNSHYGQSPSYNSYCPMGNGYSGQYMPYYPQSQVMQSYHHSYPYYPGYQSYGYY